MDAFRPGRAATVYPRVCGGTAALATLFALLEGLSPRVRGNPATRLCRPAAERSIPACAGEPYCAIAQRRLGEVYPRVCGGTRTPSAPRSPLSGLSPRVRGNPAAAGLCRR